MIGPRALVALFGTGLTLVSCQIGGEFFPFPFGQSGGGEADAGHHNRPPVLTLVYIAPAETGLGAPISLTARAEDPDGDVVSLHWSGSGGTIKESQSGDATYVCKEAGEHALFVTAEDPGGLLTIASFTVKCV